MEGEKRKIQRITGKNTYVVTIPKFVMYLLGLKKGDSLFFKNEGKRIYIEGERNECN